MGEDEVGVEIAELDGYLPCDEGGLESARKRTEAAEGGYVELDELPKSALTVD